MTKSEALDQNETPEVEDQDESQEDASEDPSNESESNESNDESSQEEGSNEDENDDDNESDSESDEDDDDDAMVPLSKLRKVRNEAKNLRDRLKIAEDRVSELESQTADEALTKANTDLQAEVDRLTKTLTTERLGTHLTREADEHGAIEPAAVVKLVDADSVEWSDDGKPTNLETVMADMKKDYPRLFSVVQGTGNTGNRSNQRGSDEAMTPSSRLSNAYKK